MYKWIAKAVFHQENKLQSYQARGIEKAVKLINNRLRKLLDYKTPFEVLSSNKSDIDALQI